MDSDNTAERSVEETIALLSKWFTTVCKFELSLANQLSCELVHEAGITNVEQFSMLQQNDPNWLDGLKCQLQTLPKILIKANVEKIGRTPLRHLDLEDVRGVINSCLSESSYGAMFKEKNISGFALSCVESVDALVEFGVTNTIHAGALFAYINEWKRIGVPNDMIAENTLRNVYIKEEAFRETSRSSNSSRNALAPSSSTSEAPHQETEANNTTSAPSTAKKAPTPQRVLSSYVGTGSSSDPVCFSSSASEAGSDDEEEEVMEVEVEKEDEQSVHTTHSTHTSCTAQSSLPPTPQVSQLRQQAESTSREAVVHQAGGNTAERSVDLGADGGAEHTDDDNDEHLASISTFDFSSDHHLDHASEDKPLETASDGLNNAISPSDMSSGSSDLHQDHQDQEEPQDHQDHPDHLDQNNDQEQPIDLTDTTAVQDLTCAQKAAEALNSHDTRRKRTLSADSTGDKAVSGIASRGTAVASKRPKRTKADAPRFPGIPDSPALRPQYAPIVTAIEDTRPGKVIRIHSEHIKLLLSTPRSAIQGHWEFQDMRFQPTADGYLPSGQVKQNVLRADALVFIPNSLRRADAMVSPGRELIFIESHKKRWKTEWRPRGQETLAASSGDSSNEEEDRLGEALYGCRVRANAHTALPPRTRSHAKVTQFLPEPESEDFIYTRPFPGIPHDNGASPKRYAGIIEAIEASRAGKMIRVSKEDIQTLILTPAEEVGGHWEFRNRWSLPDDCELSPTLKRQSVLLKHALVFVPNSDQAINSISMKGAPPRELVFVESTKKPSQRNVLRDESPTSGESEAEVVDARRQYGTRVEAPEGQSEQQQVVTHSDVALSSAQHGGRVLKTATGDSRQTFAEHFNHGPYPGIPPHEELREQYKPIVDKIEATRVGDGVFCTEEEVTMLLTLPEEFINGIWVRADRSDAVTNSALAAAGDIAANALRANSLVFIPSSMPEPGLAEATEIVIVELKNSSTFGPSPQHHVLKQIAEINKKASTNTSSKAKAGKAPKGTSGATTPPSVASSSSKSNTSTTSAPQTQVTYGEHFGERPFPGIPQHPLLQEQYGDIVDRIRATQIGEAVLVTENQRDMLRAVPEALVSGRWVQQDTSYHLGRADSLQDSRDMERRAKSLVFLPSAAARPVEVPLLQRSNPATAENIVIVTSAPKKVKTKSLEVVEPLKKKAPAKAAAKTVTKPAAAKRGKTVAVKSETAPASKETTVYSVRDSDSEGSDDGASARASGRSLKRAASSDEDDGNETGGSGRPKRNAAVKALKASSSAVRRHSSAHETVSVSARSVTSAATGRHSLGSTGSSGRGGGVLAYQEAVRKACHDAIHSRDDKIISDAVKYLGDAAAKNDSYAVDLMLSTDTYRRLFFFLQIAPELPADKNNFIYRTLKTITTIITRLDGFPQIELIFQYDRFGVILQQCLSGNGEVRQQALVLVSDIGVTDEGDIKQRVLSAGAVKIIIESFYSASSFSTASTRLRTQGHCARCLYKLASSSTPRQFESFVPALGLLREVLLSDLISWEFVIEAAQAVNFFVVPKHPRQIDVLMEHNFFDILVEIFSDDKRIVGLRWHASLFIWSVAKYCDNAQVRKMFRLMGVLGNVFHLDHAHPHLRAAALNIMQVLLLRGESVIQQFVYHRDSIPANAMALVRDHEHEQLVHVNKRSSNCIVKYASFSLAHAVVGANSEQLIRLLELGAYPLLFKIVSFEGEEAQPEEAKVKAVAALSHLLQEVPNEAKHYQQREERQKCVDFALKWDLIRALVTDRVEADEDSEDEHGSSAAEESKTEEVGEFVWSEELRNRAQELLELAREVDLAK